MSVLVLITDAYPLGGITEQAFIKPEIEPLAAVFHRVILMPVNTNLLTSGTNTIPKQQLPPNVTVSHALLSKPSAFGKACSVLHYRSITALATDMRKLPNLASLRHLMAFSAYTLHYRRKLMGWLKQNAINPDDTLFYTFWFEAATAALSTIPGLKIVSRAHGHDIYSFRPNFISPYWRRLSLNRLISLHPASEAGANYLRQAYPTYTFKIDKRFLGSPQPLAQNPVPQASDCPLVLLSCSRLAEGKGVELQIELIKEWARRNPPLHIHWLCIGGGPLEEKIKASTADLPSNLTAEMTGPIDNESVHKLLRTHHIDASLLLSESEGLPIAMVEALSYGIPIITTPVGELAEMTTLSGGLLLSEHPTSEVFCTKMDEFLLKLASTRGNAEEYWRRNFDAALLRKTWARELSSLI